MIYIITAVHNRFSITEKFVKNLIKQTYKDFKLILVDDGSTDGTSEMVLSYLPDSVIIRGNGNLWWGGALHKAYKWVLKNTTDEQNDDFVLFANDDTDFDESYIEKAISILNSREKTLLTGCGISRQTGKLVDASVTVDFNRLTKTTKSIGFGNCASTRSLFFKVGDFKKIGGFHPVLLPHYGSDYEWTIRACRKYGYSVFCDESLKYFADETTTGNNFYDKMTLKQLFSKRSVSNPFYKINYIFLITPFSDLVKSLSQQIGRYFKKLSLFVTISKRK